MSDDQDVGEGPVNRYFLELDASGNVVGTASGNADHAGWVEVGADVYRQAGTGQFRWDGKQLVPFTPAPIAPYGGAREQVGAVFLRAVVDLGWWDFFEQGAAYQAAPTAQGGAGKPYDQRAWATIGKTDRVMVLDAPLTRVARAAEAARVAASGQPAPSAPIITLAAAMDHGDAMGAAGS